MNKKEQYGIVILITAILLFQIWVADAETQRNKETLLSKNPQVLWVMNKIINDGYFNLKNKEGFELNQTASMQKSQDQELNAATNSANTIKPKKNNPDFVWYKPWTWFGA